MIKKIFFAVFTLVSFSSCYMLRAYRYRKFNLSDVNKMPHTMIAKGDSPYHFIESPRRSYETMSNKLDSLLADTYTAAFLIIRNDSIIYEKYFNGFSQQSLLPSFSVAKSFVGTLIGIAIDEGKMKPEESITKYLPELTKNDPRFEKISIRNLLDMRSGILFNEGTYNLKDDAVKLGFRPNTFQQIKKLKIEKDPGGEFNYQSINTYLLALAIQRAMGEKLSIYLSDKIWKPAGMEYNATWTIDSKKHKQELAFAGLNATARDFAKLGAIYLNKGYFNNHRILSAQWVNATVNKDTMELYNGYRNQFWGSTRYLQFVDSSKAYSFKNEHSFKGIVQSFTDKNQQKKYFIRYSSSEFFAEGILGEFVFVNPEKNLIMVRLGHNWNSKQYQDLESFLQALSSEL